MLHPRPAIVDPYASNTLEAPPVTRRSVLRAAALLGAGALGLRSAVARACPGDEGSARVCPATEDNIEGPYYLGGSPVRDDLTTASMPGTRLELEGALRSTACSPLAGARIEVWQADDSGRYDLRGHTLRGALVTDARGRFRLRTIVPGHYLNGDRYRPAHIHLKAWARGHRPLTTQLYFARDPHNQGDPWLRPSLVLDPRRDGRGLHAARDIVLVPA